MTHCSIGQSPAAGAAERGTARLAHVTFLCCRAALSFKKVTKGVRIFDLIAKLLAGRGPEPEPEPEPESSQKRCQLSLGRMVKKILMYR
eukprot:COSAG05_NODE_4466_length_1502_cov_4.539558_1_plen_89_part_00